MARKDKDIPNPFAAFGSADNGTPVEQQTSVPAQQYNSKPVEQHNSVPAQQYNSKPVEQHNSKPVVKKYTYYLPPEKNLKLEQIRLARLARGIVIDKSALVSEAIDLLME